MRVSPTRSKSLLLQKAQQLALQRRRDLPNLVEEQRPPSATSTRPGLIADGAGERTSHVAEQLAGQQLLGQRRAVGDDEGAAARGLWRWMARARMLLPVPFSPVISTGASVAATRAAMSSTACMAGRLAGDLDVGDLLGQAAFQLGDPGGQVALRLELLDQVANLGRRERLRQVVPGAPPHRLDGRLDGAVGGDEDDGQAGLLAEQLGEQVEAALGPQRQVDEGEVIRLPANRRQRGVAGADGQRLGAEPFHADRQRGPDVFLVVDDRDAQTAGDRVNQLPLMDVGESYLVPTASGGRLGQGAAELLIQRQIQLEDVDPRLSQEAEIAPLGAVLDDRADAVLGHVAGAGDARGLPERGFGRQVGIEAAGRGGDQRVRDRQRRGGVFLLEAGDVGGGAVAQLLRGGPEVRARGGGRIVAVVAGRRGAPLDVGRRSEDLADQLRADHLARFVVGEAAVGAVAEQGLGGAGGGERVEDARQDERDERGAESDQDFFSHGEPQTRWSASSARSMSLMPANGAMTPPTP